jgi:hypothetical protein
MPPKGGQFRQALEIFGALPRIVIQVTSKNIQAAAAEYFSAQELAR